MRSGISSSTDFYLFAFVEWAMFNALHFKRICVSHLTKWAKANGAASIICSEIQFFDRFNDN